MAPPGHGSGRALRRARRVARHEARRAATSGPPGPATAGPCLNEGRVLERTDGGGRACECEGKWVHACDAGHGECTRTKAGLREGVRLCGPACPGYDADR